MHPYPGSADLASHGFPNEFPGSIRFTERPLVAELYPPLTINQLATIQSRLIAAR